MPRKTTRKGVYQSSTYLAAVLLVLIIFVSAAAVMLLSVRDDGQDRRDLLEELAAGRALWVSARPDAFRYVVERSCACPAEDSAAYVATERYGERSAQFRVPVESVDGEFLSAPPRPVWIADLFILIETALLGGESVTASYDRDRGYPVYVAIGGNAPSAESGRRYRIRDFEVLREWSAGR